MAYRGHIQYNPATDPKQYFAQGFENYLGGLNQQAESKRFGKALTESGDPFMQQLGQMISSGNLSQKQAVAMGGLMQRNLQDVPGPTKQQTQRDRDLAVLADDKKAEFRKSESRIRIDNDQSYARKPVPPGQDYTQFLEKAQEIAASKGGSIKEGKLFGKKAYEVALRMAEDFARGQAMNPKDIKADFDRWWDA